MQTLRDTATHLDEVLGRGLRVVAPAGIELRYGAHGAGVERRQLEARVGAEPGWEVGTLGRRHHENRKPGQLDDELAERLQVRFISTVNVIGHEQRRRLCLARISQRRARRLRCVRARDVEDPDAVLPQLAGQLGRQPRLAHAARRREQHQPAGAAARSLPVLTEPVQLALPARQERARVELWRQLRRLDRPPGKRRILGEDRALQLPQALARLDPQSLDQAPSGVVVGLQRVRLPVAAVEREHQLRPESLPVGMVADQRLEPWHHLVMPAELELRLNQQLERRGPQVIEPGHLVLGERLVCDVCKRRALP